MEWEKEMEMERAQAKEPERAQVKVLERAQVKVLEKVMGMEQVLGPRKRQAGSQQLVAKKG